jgi:PilZ domain-containing protein
MSQRRNYFRIQFPITQRPRLVVSTAEFEVLELAETGARIIVGDAQVSETSGEFEATIQFPDGASASVTARVHRREINEAVLRFAANLPYPIIAGQQRRLLKLFPRQATSPAAATK